ncbi:MAG: hypothetical protein ACRDL0_08000 [Thermoleophilaceae bacterium]
MLGRQVFSVDDEGYRWEDVVLAARAWGEWATVESGAAEGVACAHRAAAEGAPFSQDDLGSAASAFRYARHLLAGDEMKAWLERWELDVEGWEDFIRRSLMRERWSAELAETAARFPAPAGEVSRALWVDAICSGALEAFAHALAARAAVHAALDPPAERAPETASRIALLEESFHRFRERVLTSEALEQLVRARETDWLRFQCRALTFPHEGMAREAALCVRDDGMELEEVAGNAGASVERLHVLLEDAEPPLEDLLVSAGEGELLGPLPVGERFLLVSVDSKTNPSLEDSSIRERAERELVERAVRQEAINRVRWHERL